MPHIPRTSGVFRGRPLVWTVHQERCLERVRRGGSRALLFALAPGAGKTLVLLAASAILREQEGSKFRAVFVIPPSLFGVWEEHVREFWEPASWRTIFVRTTADATSACTGSWDACFVSPHLLSRLFTAAFRFGPTRSPDGRACRGWSRRSGAVTGALSALRAPTVLAVDEAHHFRRPDPAAPQAAVLRYLGARAGHILAATGTPVVSDERDACATLRNFGASEVALDSCGSDGRVSRDGSAVFGEAHIVRVTAAELSEALPPMHVRVEPLDGVRLPEAYDELVRRARAVARTSPRSPQLIGVYQTMLRLCAEAKGDALATRVRKALAAHRKVIVCSPTVGPLEKLRESLQDVCPELFTGRQSDGQRSAALARFRGEPDRRVLLLSQQAGGEGLTICEASCVIFACAGYHPSDDAQVQARVWRRGQTAACEAVYLPIARSLEEAILRLQRDKRALEGAILDGSALQGKWKQGGSLLSQLQEFTPRV